jgi:hypothetical protein
MALPAAFADAFRSPPADARGAPFWAWNGRLDQPRLDRQIGWFQEMGIGGFMMHARTGLDTEYMSAEFLQRIKDCVSTAKKRGMKAWLYDEDRWPSGFGGALVTGDPRHRARHLLVTLKPYEQQGAADQGTISCAYSARSGNGRLVARWAVRQDADGRIAGYRRLAAGEAAPAGHRLWYGYLEQDQPTSWFNNATYVDSLSPAAIKRFIEVTHDRFAEAVGDEFGRTVPAIFTDEPQITAWRTSPTPTADNDCILCWTEDFADSHLAVHGFDPLDRVPELLWDGAGSAAARWCYWDHVSFRFAQAFADQIGDWCGKRGIHLSGHMMQEGALPIQVQSTGETMRHYKGFGIPGIDLLCDSVEIITAKQCQSAKHQYGRQDMLSEMYGVTDWDFPFAGHKAQGDWQAALGVTVRTHHLAWMGMLGEAKRDYPASIFYQSPWFREYPLVEDHFARVAVALRQGRPRIRLAVVHPVESTWTEIGPDSVANPRMWARDNTFKELLGWLVHGLVDFDFVCESRLPELCPRQEGARLAVGAMAYEMVLVPDLATIRATTLERLEAVAAAGGTVVFAGRVPALVDGRPSDRAQCLAARCRRIACERGAVLAAVEPLRELAVVDSGGNAVPGLFSQMREEGDARILFLCNPDRTANRWGGLPDRWNLSLRIKGSWSVAALDTGSGAVQPADARLEDGWTVVPTQLASAGHALYRLTAGLPVAVPSTRTPPVRRSDLPQPHRVTLSEPNVLLLDRPEWKVGDGAWQPAEEILRVDNRIRIALGMGERTGNIAEPWTDRSPTPVIGHATLRFRWTSEVAIAGAKLAIEEPQHWRITLDGAAVAVRDDGWWTDEDIRTVALPAMSAGEHVLELTVGYTRTVSIERMYLLGDFAVWLRDVDATLAAPVRTLRWGDWVTQGLPFYGGNVTYHVAIAGDGAAAQIKAPEFAAPLLKIAVDGAAVGHIAYSPWQCALGSPAAGGHELAITAFGHRRNCFGCLHLAKDIPWVGPDAWRTSGDRWVEGYAFRRTGVLAAPWIEHFAR